MGGGNEILSEDGPRSGEVLTVTNRQGRRLGLQLTQPTGNAWWQTNAYDAAGRLATLASPAGAFGYSYKSAAGVSPATLVGGISLPTTGGTGVAYVTNFHDPTGRLTSTGLRSSDHSVLNLHEHAYPDAVGTHQRALAWVTGADLAGKLPCRPRGMARAVQGASWPSAGWRVRGGALTPARSRRERRSAPASVRREFHPDDPIRPRPAPAPAGRGRG